jgi:signal transduction histidine kinase
MGLTMSVGGELDARQIATEERRKLAGRSTWLAAVTALLLLPVLARSPTLRAPTLEATLETTMTCGALAAAWLLHARFADSQRVRDLLAMAAVGALGLMNLCDRVLPVVLTTRAGTALIAVQLWSQLALAGLFAAAAFTSGSRLVTRPRPLVAVATAASVAAAVAATLAGLLLGPAAHGTGATTSLLDHPLAAALSIAAIALLGSSAVRLASRDEHGAPDRTAATLATASVLLAAAGLYQLLDGLTPIGTVAPTQLPRMLAFALVLLAAAWHEPHARARVAQAAALAERRRVARDLHDRLAQDLAFIAAHGPALSAEMGEDHPLVIAAGRALAISRSTITELSDPAEATAAEALEAVAQELRDQFDIAIAVNVVRDTDLEPRAREHVTRISREAIANAARHGGARNVSVSLTRLELTLVLRVVDDGRGLVDADGATTPEGFGLGSMRERAAALGGHLSVHQPRRGGTELEVVFQ